MIIVTSLFVGLKNFLRDGSSSGMPAALNFLKKTDLRVKSIVIISNKCVSVCQEVSKKYDIVVFKNSDYFKYCQFIFANRKESFYFWGVSVLGPIFVAKLCGVKFGIRLFGSGLTIEYSKLPFIIEITKNLRYVIYANIGPLFYLCTKDGSETKKIIDRYSLRKCNVYEEFNGYDLMEGVPNDLSFLKNRFPEMFSDSIDLYIYGARLTYKKNQAELIKFAHCLDNRVMILLAGNSEAPYALDILRKLPTNIVYVGELSKAQYFALAKYAKGIISVQQGSNFGNSLIECLCNGITVHTLRDPVIDNVEKHYDNLYVYRNVQELMASLSNRNIISGRSDAKKKIIRDWDARIQIEDRIIRSYL